jgi:hypothetical protein
MVCKVVDFLYPPFGDNYELCFIYLFRSSLSNGIQMHVKGCAVVRYVQLAVGRLWSAKLLYVAISTASYPVKVGIFPDDGRTRVCKSYI